MPTTATVRVEGYRELLRAISLADRKQKRELRETLRHAGEAVRVEAGARIGGKDTRTAGGYRTRVRQSGIAVEQSIRKSTGAHPEWGAYQMRHALLPALYSNAEETEHAMQRALDQIADQFNRGG